MKPMPNKLWYTISTEYNRLQAVSVIGCVRRLLKMHRIYKQLLVKTSFSKTRPWCVHFQFQLLTLDRWNGRYALGHSYANPDHFHFIHLCSDSRNGCDFRVLTQMKETWVEYDVTRKCMGSTVISPFVRFTFKCREHRSCWESPLASRLRSGCVPWRRNHIIQECKRVVHIYFVIIWESFVLVLLWIYIYTHTLVYYRWPVFQYLQLWRHWCVKRVPSKETAANVVFAW
jgi:hypothetical protein